MKLRAKASDDMVVTAAIAEAALRNWRRLMARGSFFSSCTGLARSMKRCSCTRSMLGLLGYFVRLWEAAS
jgi:hypothetical protein